MNRRAFFATSALSAAALAFRSSPAHAAAPASAAGNAGRFRLKYAPSLGQFKTLAGPDLATQIQFIADQGFTALFDNGIMNRPAEQQDLIAREARRLGLTLGPFVLYADFSKKAFVTRDKEVRAMLLQTMQRGPRDDGADRVPAGVGRPRPLRREPGVGLPDRQRGRQPARVRGAVRAEGPGARARAAEPEEPPGPVPDEDPAGLRHLQGGPQPVLQDPR